MAIVKQKGNTYFADISGDIDKKKVIKAFESLIEERGKGTIRVIEKPEAELAKGGSAENFVITGFSKDFSASEIGNAIDKSQEAAKLERIYKQISREALRAADKADGRASNVRLVEPVYGGDIASNIAKALERSSSYPDGRHIKVRTSYEDKKSEKVYKNFTAWESKEEGKSRKVNFKEEGKDNITSVDVVRRKGTGAIEIAAFAEALSESKALGNAMKFKNNVNVSIEQEVSKEGNMRSVVNSVVAASEKMDGKGLVAVTANFDGSNAIAIPAKQPEVAAPKVAAPKVAEVDDIGR